MEQPARLTVLGSGTALPLPGRGSSCYLVEDGAGATILVDCGPGALLRAARHGADLAKIDAVLVTHVHPDHCSDLAALLFGLRSPALGRRAAPLRVCGHAQVALLLARLRNAWPGWLEPEGRRLSVQALAAGERLAIGGTEVRAGAVVHHGSSLGYRLQLPNGRVLAFSGDAVEGGELADLGRDSDLFVLEAAGADESPIPGHLTPRRAARLAAACGARSLLLTHFYPAALATPLRDRALEAFEGRLLLAQDGLVVPLHG